MALHFDKPDRSSAMTWQDFITTDTSVLAGKPVVRGTRLAADFLPGLFAAGWTKEQSLGGAAAVSHRAKTIGDARLHEGVHCVQCQTPFSTPDISRSRFCESGPTYGSRGAKPSSVHLADGSDSSTVGIDFGDRSPILTVGISGWCCSMTAGQSTTRSPIADSYHEAQLLPRNRLALHRPD